MDWSIDWFCRLSAVSSVAVCRGTTATPPWWPLCCPCVLLEGRRRGVSAEVAQVVAARWTHYLWSVSSGHSLSVIISQLLNLFIDSPRICNFILLFIVWVRSFSKMLPSVKFAEGKVLVFVILRQNSKIVQLLSLTLILILISSADWSDKSEWYCQTVHCCQINLVQ